ncbi:MAG: DUF302 domain-containing protein [Candidatus Limnocylindrales bacterium]
MRDTLGEYAFTVHLDTGYEDALERTVAALKEQGFGVVTEIDMRATMRQKLDLEFRKYAILGACNPSLAIRALTTEPQVGLLLPCNVIVYEDEDGGGSTVSVVDPLGMLADIEAEGLQSVADEAHARLAKVASSLAG